MSEQSADAEALEALGLGDLSETMASLEKITQTPDPIPLALTLSEDAAKRMLTARLALAAGNYTALTMLLETLVDPVLHAAAHALHERHHPEPDNGG